MSKQPLSDDRAPPAYSEINLGAGPSMTHLGHEQPFSSPPYPTQTGPVMPQPMPMGSTVITVAPTHGHGGNHQQRNIMIINARRPRVIIDEEMLPPFSTQVMCPCCRQLVNTRIEYRPGSSTHFAAILLCVFGCWPCCILPYFMTACQFPAHFCPNCQTFLGLAPNV